METPFKISLRKKIKSTDKEEIIRLFLINSKGTLHDKTVTDDEEIIIIKGKIFSYDISNNFLLNE